MKIVYLLESSGLWGGVKSVFEAANRLQDRGHEVTVLSRSPRPTWIELRCGFETVPDFAPEHIPAADFIVGTFWTTVPFAVQSGKGTPVHYCQGFEGGHPEMATHREQIEQIYRLPQTHKLTISPHLTQEVADLFGWQPREIRYAIDHDVMYPREQRDPGRPVRVGLVGPYTTACKDIPAGIEACRLAHQAGLDLQLVRVTNTEPHPAEQQLPFPVEWHVQVEPARMGEIYRSLDVFVGPGRGPEGFYMPAVEAMACGVPTVLTDIPPHRGYGSEQYALFIPVGDACAMAEAIVVAAGHPRVRAELREQGIQVASRYNYTDHIADLEAAFTEFAAISATTPAPANGSDQYAADGLLQFENSDYRGAVASFEKAIDNGLQTSEAYNNLGVALFHCGDEARARACFARALEIDPWYEDAKVNLQEIAS